MRSMRPLSMIAIVSIMAPPIVRTFIVPPQIDRPISFTPCSVFAAASLLLTSRQISTHLARSGARLVPRKWNSVDSGAKSRHQREESISAKHVLLGDIGATNARFALLANGALGPVKVLRCQVSRDLRMRLASFLKDHCQQAQITEAVFAVAGPVEDDRCVLTNCSWVIDARELHDTFGMKRGSSTTSRPWRIRCRPSLGGFGRNWRAGRPNQEPRWQC